MNIPQKPKEPRLLRSGLIPLNSHHEREVRSFRTLEHTGSPGLKRDKSPDRVWNPSIPFCTLHRQQRMMAMRREHPRSRGESTLPDGAATRVIALLRECPDDKVPTPHPPSCCNTSIFLCQPEHHDTLAEQRRGDVPFPFDAHRLSGPAQLRDAHTALLVLPTGCSARP